MWTWLPVCLGAVLAFAAGWRWASVRAAGSVRTATEPDLLANRELFALAEEAAGFGVWQSDIDNEWTWLSAGAAALSGYPAEPTRRRGAELFDLIHPDDREPARRIAGDAVTRGEGFQCEFRVRQPDGSYRWRRNRGRVDVIDSQAVRVVGAIADIHPETVTMERLGDTARRMTLAEDVAGFGVWELDVPTNVMVLSAGAASLSGFEARPMQVPGVDVMQRIHPEDLAQVGPLIEQSLREGTPYRVDCRVTMPSGDLRWIRSQARVEMSGGRATRVTGAIIDITRERVLLDQLRQSAERMRLAEEAAGFGVWEVDRLADTVTLSEGMLRLHGLPPDAPLRYRREEFAGLLDADHLALVREASDKSFETGQPFQIDTMIQGRDGTAHWRRIRARPEYQDGVPWRLVGSTLDVTREKQMFLSLEHARSKAEAATQAKSEFLANMSHEIRTPLNGVMGMTRLLLDSPLTDQQRDWAETAMVSGTSLLSIINDILDFSKIEAGKLAIDSISFDLRRLLEDVAGLLAPKAADKGIALLVRYSPGTPVHLMGDADRIRQVVLNLANNAIKFTDSGHVLLTAECLSQDAVAVTLRIGVSDTGIGIAPHALETLFDKFTQADSSTTRRYGGTGLGLAISKRLVELMHGAIAVESQEGQGSSFSFTLQMPLASPVEDGAPLPFAQLRGARVLVVDGNVVSRRVFHEQLTSYGLRCAGAASVNEALHELRGALGAADPFQIVLVDHVPANLDGIRLATLVRAEAAFANVVFVLLTTVGHVIDQNGLERIGIDGSLHKPVRQARLLSLLAAAWPGRQGDARRAGTAAIGGATASSSQEELASMNLRVLVVEDNAVNQKVAVALLNRIGVKAEVAGDGQEAVDRVRAGAYDVILMDCHMPRMNGYDASLEIRRLETGGRRTPILAMTADVIESSRQRALDAGMDGFITKPVDLQELAQAIRAWTKRAA